jgi:uncharacterized protein YyaL (SSP411 family)
MRIVKNIALGLLVCGMTLPAMAADSVWLTSVPAAQALAKKENKLVLLDFTGSDWCVWCKKLDEETYSKPAFLNYAKSNLVLVTVDFPIQKKLPDDLAKANDALKSKYLIEGYPTEIALKPDGTVVWKNAGYLEGGPAAMIAQLEKAKKK